MAVGGMPQAVEAYVNGGNFEEIDKVKRTILKLYEEDFYKIDPSGRLSKMYNSIPNQLAANKKRYVISSATGKRTTNKDKAQKCREVTRCTRELPMRSSALQWMRLRRQALRSWGSLVYKDDRILSTDLKKMAGFGKGGEKNYPGIITGLQMQTYLVITDFKRRKNKRGEEYGMAVSIMLPPESIWGYDKVTAAYKENPKKSWSRIFEHVKQMYPKADGADIIRLIGKA